MLEVRVFGQFDVRLDGEPIELPSRPAQRLLAYLILSAGIAHPREKLAGLLWPDAEESNARRNLRIALWRLRKALEPGGTNHRGFLLSDDLSIAFDADSQYWLDAAVLDRKRDPAWSVDELIEVVSTYRGELLPGFYDEWAVRERDRLQALFEHRMQLLLEELVAEKRWREVLEWGEHWISFAHAPEPAYRALMVAHAALGDLSSVTAILQRCTEALQRELGVQPSEETLALHERLSQGEEPGAAPLLLAALPAPGPPPFKGLHYFDEGDAQLFFGRERLTARLLARLAEDRFLAVVGASGSGKSSLVRAGLVPRLKLGEPLSGGTVRHRDGASWSVRVITPTSHPSSPFSSQEGRGGGLRHCLVVDQFEELFTLCRDEGERRAFVDSLIAAALEPGGSTWVVIALRADFYAHCAEFESLRDLLASRQEYIGPMSAAELRRAIEEPASRGGWELEPGLVDLLLRDVGGEPGALPLLSHALLETWQRCRGRLLTLSGYAESGGVQGAIAKTAETVFSQRLTVAEQAIARNIFLRLTELGEGTQDTRRRAPLGELISQPTEAPAVERVLTTLADARLITTSAGSAEVAHEALIREWPTLRRWLVEDREALRFHRHLTEAAQEWERLNRDPGELYRGTRLSQARDWAAAHDDQLNALERDFLDASGAVARHEEVERETRRQRELEAAQALAAAEARRAEGQAQAARQLRRRAFFLGAALLAAALFAAGTLLLGQAAGRNAAQARVQEATAVAERGRAEREARIAFARELVTAANSNLDVDPERSILLALHAVSVTASIDSMVLPEAEEALHQAVLASRVTRVLSGHTAELLGVAFSPDGARLATASQDQTAKLWDAATGEELISLSGHHAPVNDVVFSPDGSRVVTAGDDHTAKLWDAASGRELLTLTGHRDWVNRVAFSSDGTKIATASLDGSARVWDATSGEELVELSGHDDVLFDVAFHPDGTRIATCSLDGVVKVWDVASGRELLSLSVSPGSEARAVTFSPDGRYLAATDGFGAKFWNLATGNEARTVSGHTNLVHDVSFSPDGTRLATAGRDWKLKLWEVASGRELVTLAGHTNDIDRIAFSPDGTHLATASFDRTARVWDISPGHELLTLPDATGDGQIAISPDGTRVAKGLPNGTAKVWDIASGQELLTVGEHGDQVIGVAFSPDGARLATTSRDATGRLWDAATGERLAILAGHAGYIAGVAFSPDGARLATAASDGTVRLWNVATAERLLTLLGHDDTVVDVAFRPDGAQLATASFDRTAKLWDAASGQELRTFSGHTDLLRTIAFSLDGTRVAAAGADGTARVWDPATGRELLAFSAHSEMVTGVVFSPDGERLATSGWDGLAKLWDSTSGEEIMTLYGDGARLHSLAFTPDGYYVATAGDTGVRVYVLRVGELIALARSRLTRSLTTAECQTYLHVDECPAIGE